MLRDLANGQARSELDGFIREAGNSFRGTADRFRLNLRTRDREFFSKYVQSEGAITEFLAEDVATFSDSQKRIHTNVNCLHRELSKINDPRRESLVRFIIQQCYLVVVTATDRDSAYRIFSVMNDRGLDLSPTDILKAETIGTIAAPDQDNYGEKWENIEESVGRDGFRDLFAHIRMITLKTKLRRTLQADFQDNVLKDAAGIDFIDNTLEPYASVYETLLGASYESTRDAGKVNGYLRQLGRLDNFDWIPPAMAFFRRNSNDRDNLIRFTKDLERLAYGLFVRRANINDRINRYADVLREIERDDDLFDDNSALQLSDDEKEEIVDGLDGKIYLQTAVVRRTLLERLDSLLADTGASYARTTITVEHVLPQTPRADSEWMTWFPADDERDAWTHRLVNLVLLSRRKNASASNWDFERKKRAYFQRGGVAPFALTAQVLSEREWTPMVLERRQQQLIGALRREWRLAGLIRYGFEYRLPIELPSGPGGARRGKQPSSDDPCFLCEVIAGREDKGIVEETDQTLTFVNWKQFELGQVYVIPRRHAPTLFDLTDGEAIAITRAVRRVAEALLKVYDPDGLNLIQNNGIVAGQEAPHFHMHVVPRRKEGSQWGNGPPHIAVMEGKQPTKPSRDVLVTIEREYEIADEIRRHLPQLPEKDKA